jgi:hypothetical protein
MEVDLKEILALRSVSTDDIWIECVAYSINPRDTSKILGALNSLAPLQRYGLGHLKRVKRTILADDVPDSTFSDGGSYRFTLEVLLCPQTEVAYLSDEAKSAAHVSAADATKVVRVCRFEALDRKELEIFTKEKKSPTGIDEGWPVNFRPSLDVRTRDAQGTVYGHSKEELQFVGHIVTIAKADADMTGALCHDTEVPPTITTSRGGAVVVNPVNNQVAAISSDYYQNMHHKLGDHRMLKHPYTSEPCCAALRAIEAVATIVRGEAEDPGPKHPIIGSIATALAAGILGEEDLALPEDFYLCTGLDFFLTHEPDLMTAMALTHSRVRRVYYLQKRDGNGAIESHYQLHARRDLNHRYRAFETTLKTT